MPRNKSHTNRASVSPTERTALIPPGPSSTDAALEAAALRAHDTNDQANSKPNDSPKSHAAETKDPRHKEGGHTAANQSMTRTRAAFCAFALAGLIFLQATNISLLTTTQSAIAADLRAFDNTTWFTSSYLIAMSALTPLSGKLAAVFSPRICIFTSTLILALGCGVCSIAANFVQFIIGRAITGIGAGGIFTVSIIVVLELTGSRRRGLSIGLLNSGYTIGVAAGAVVAGALLPLVGWRALFWMQIPFAIVGGVTLFVAIPHDFTAGKKDGKIDSTWNRVKRLDYFGALTLTTAITFLLFALSSPRQIPLLPIVLSAIILLTFALNEIYLAHDPIIPVTLLRSRGLLLTCLGTVGYMMARWAVLFYSPTYAIAVRQWSPASAGSILVPTNVGFALGGLGAGFFHIRRKGSFYFPTLVVYALFPLTLVALALLSTPTCPPLLYFAVVFVNGVVTGAALNYNLAHLLHLTPSSTHYIGTSLLATFRGFAGSFGSAIGGGLFTRQLYASLIDRFDLQGMRNKEDLIRRLLGSPALVRSLQGTEREVAVGGYQDAVKTLFLAGAGLALAMIFVQAGTGWKGAESTDKDAVDDEAHAGDNNEEERRLIGNDEGRTT